VPRGRPDEEALTADIVALASQYEGRRRAYPVFVMDEIIS
jgi:hypothetical protein